MAFRDVLTEASEAEALWLLESSRCPEPPEVPWTGEYDAIVLQVEGEAVVFRTENERAWVQSDHYTDLASAR